MEQREEEREEEREEREKERESFPTLERGRSRKALTQRGRERRREMFILDSTRMAELKKLLSCSYAACERSREDENRMERWEAELEEIEEEGENG